jgi:hypothetical protein
MVDKGLGEKYKGIWENKNETITLQFVQNSNNYCFTLKFVYTVLDGG